MTVVLGSDAIAASNALYVGAPLVPAAFGGENRCT